MKKAVLFISALLFSFLNFYSSHLIGSEIPAKYLGSDFNVCYEYTVDETPLLFFNSELPNDTNAYLYLDPLSNTLYLSISLENPAKISIIVLDILGTVVWMFPETTYDPGKQLLSGALDLNYGQYIVKVMKNGSVYKTQKILVIK